MNKIEEKKRVYNILKPKIERRERGGLVKTRANLRWNITVFEQTVPGPTSILWGPRMDSKQSSFVSNF